MNPLRHISDKQSNIFFIIITIISIVLLYTYCLKDTTNSVIGPNYELESKEPEVN